MSAATEPELFARLRVFGAGTPQHRQHGFNLGLFAYAVFVPFEGAVRPGHCGAADPMQVAVEPPFFDPVRTRSCRTADPMQVAVEPPFEGAIGVDDRGAIGSVDAAAVRAPNRGAIRSSDG